MGSLRQEKGVALVVLVMMMLSSRRPYGSEQRGNAKNQIQDTVGTVGTCI